VNDQKSQKDHYLGRDSEIKYIRDCTEATDDSRHVIYVSGPGGVGKTALLDQILQSSPSPDAGDVVLAAVDFDDLTLRLPVNFMERVAEQLSSQGFRDMFQAFGDLRERPPGNLAERKERQEQARRAFVEGLQELTQHKRLVMLIDTLEKAPIWFPAFFAGVVSPVPNTVIVLVGRPASRRIEQALERALSDPGDLPAFDTRTFEWIGLDSKLCEKYFASRGEFEKFAADLTLLTVPISLDLQKRIWKLAQGIPFQINLFVGMLRFLESGSYQLNQHINGLLQEIQASQLDELEHDFELRHRFQQTLVAPFVLNFDRPKLEGGEADYDRLTSRILLLIAHINHYMAHALGGFDASVLAELDDTLTEEEVQLGLQYIEQHRGTRFSFVKLFRDADASISGIGLHDEMARMLNELGWIQIDPPGRSDSIRSEISRKLIDYYDRKCLDLYASADQRVQITHAEGRSQEELSGKIWWRAASFPRGQALLLARTFHSMYRDFRAGWHWIYGLSERIFRQSYFDALLYESVEEYVQATRVVEDHDIEARMNVWKAAALIARRDLSRGDLTTARDLLENSIAIWKKEYRDDEEEVQQLEETRDVLEGLRRDVLEELRQNPHQTAHLRATVESLNGQLSEIEHSIQANTQFSDLERAYTSLGFTYRLEGTWEEAIRHYGHALTYSRWLGNRGNIAELTNNMANVYLLWGQLTDAALYAQIGVHIRQRLNVPSELGHSLRILGIVNWRIGNTYECKKYLNRARDCYEGAVDLARVDSYEGYTYYRIGDTEVGHKALEQLPRLTGSSTSSGQDIPPVQSFSLLERARDVFEQYEETNDLSWTYNVLSRAYRRDSKFEKAERAAQKALELTQDPLRVAEANLSLSMLYHRWGMSKKEEKDYEGALEAFDKVDEHYTKGFPIAEAGQFVSQLSVYEGVKGNVEYERGELQDPSHFQAAFQHYLRECQVAARNKMLRFERALNEVVADRLARMPVDRALECANILTDPEAWKEDGLELEYRKLKDEVDELKLFLGLPEKEQIDKMEQSFNVHMRSGNYQKALDEAKNTLQQFRRYGWNIDTVRILLKVAQAYRKVTQFTQARRYCRQAMLVIDNLSQRAKPITRPIELTKQKAHANFTMGRILWEIGNTAEAATHFRRALDTYIEYRNHKDPAVATEMQEGLARSVHYEGFVHFRIGEFDQALWFLNWAERAYRKMGDIRRVSMVLNLKARIYRDRDKEGDIERAREALEKALDLVLQVGDNYATAECYLTYMNVEYQESRKRTDPAEQLFYLEKAEGWYREGAHYAHDNGYALLQSVYEGMRGNVLFDRAIVEAGEGEVDLRPAFDQYLEELRWDTHYEVRRFFRSLDLLMQRLSPLTSDDIRYYSRYLLENWEQYAKEGKLPGEEQERQYSVSAEQYVKHMRTFCQRVEDFSEYIASPHQAVS
jgi:tetratricopeptide (TPR) repeat protein